MLALKEQAIAFIKAVPDDKIIYIMDMFKGVKGLLDGEQEELTKHALLEDIKGLRGIVRADIDENYELMRARDEKYASVS